MSRSTEPSCLSFEMGVRPDDVLAVGPLMRVRKCWPRGRPSLCVPSGSELELDSVVAALRALHERQRHPRSGSRTTPRPSPAPRRRLSSPPTMSPIILSRIFQPCEWMASKSSVDSAPALIMIDSAPPGYSFRYGAVVHLFIDDDPHVLLRVVLGHLGARELGHVRGLAGASAAAFAFAAFSAASLTGSTRSIQPPCLGPAIVGCSNSSDTAPPTVLCTWYGTSSC